MRCLFSCTFLGGAIWELRVYSDLDRQGISLCQDTCGSNCILKKDYTKAEKYLNYFSEHFYVCQMKMQECGI